MIEDGAGVRAARARMHRWWRMTALAVLGTIVVAGIITGGTVAPGRMAPAFAVMAVIAFTLVVLMTAYYSDRLADEVDRMNQLRANSFGLYVLMLLLIGWHLLHTGGLLPPVDAMLVAVVAGVATLARYTMLKLAK